MSNPDGVLEAIDACLDDYALSDDAMRWAPDEPDPTPEGGEPSSCDEEISFAQLQELGEHFTVFAEGVQKAAQAIVDAFAKGLGPGLASLGVLAHRDHYGGIRKHYRRCATCNPGGNPRSMPINRAEYRRRRR